MFERTLFHAYVVAVEWAACDKPFDDRIASAVEFFRDPASALTLAEDVAARLTIERRKMKPSECRHGKVTYPSAVAALVGIDDCIRGAVRSVPPGEPAALRRRLLHDIGWGWIDVGDFPRLKDELMVECELLGVPFRAPPPPRRSGPPVDPDRAAMNYPAVERHGNIVGIDGVPLVLTDQLAPLFVALHGASASGGMTDPEIAAALGNDEMTASHISKRLNDLKNKLPAHITVGRGSRGRVLHISAPTA